MYSLKKVELAFSRTAPAITFVVLLSLLLTVMSTVYHLAAIPPSELTKLPKVQEYENRVGEIAAMDPWTRTQYYWSNNLKTAAVGAAFSLIYIPLNTSIATGYYTGIAIAYVGRVYGEEVGLAFSAQIFVHGLLEITGIYLISAGALRLAWSFWGLMGELTMGKRKKRPRGPMREALYDFIVLALTGTIMIFLAAPVEAFISPITGEVFVTQPLGAAGFLLMTAALYMLLARPGLRGMIRTAGKVVSDVKRGEFASQLALLTFLIFVMLGVFSLL